MSEEGQNEGVAGRAREYKMEGNKGRSLLLLLCLTYLFDYADRMVVGSLIPFIKQDWSLSDQELGSLTSVICQHLLGGAWSPMLVGALSDRVGLDHALLVTPVFGLIAAALLLRGAREYERDLTRVKPVTLVEE